MMASVISVARDAVCQINRFQDVFFVFAPLGLVVQGNNNRVPVQGLQKDRVCKRKYVERFINIDIRELDWNGRSPEVWIEDHIQAGDCGQAFVGGSRVLRHLQGNFACNLQVQLGLH